MLEELNYDREMDRACIKTAWTGSLYWEPDMLQYVVIIPFPSFTACGRNTSLYEAVLEANRGVKWAQAGRDAETKRKHKEEYDDVSN